MIRDIRTATEKEIRYLSTHALEVAEKLDMIYFRLDFLPESPMLLNKANERIGIEDLVVNTVYDDIEVFVDNELMPAYKDLYAKVGDVTVGIFYLPCRKAKVINYSASKAPMFILSDVRVRRRGEGETAANAKARAAREILSAFGGKLSDMPVMARLDGLGEGGAALVRRYAAGEMDAAAFVKGLTGRDLSFTGIDVSECEGVVIRSPKMRFQAIVNNATQPCDRTTTKMCRDMVLENLAKVVRENPWIGDSLDPDDDYLDKVCDLFLGYMRSTDMFTKVTFDGNDLVPPGKCYLGDLCYDLVPNGAVRTFCRLNEVAKNVFRIMVKSLAKGGFEPSYSDVLTTDDKKELDRLCLLLS